MDQLTARAARSFRQHFVTLSCLQLPAGDAPPKVWVFSGFVIDIDDEWFYVTAGHILRDVQAAILKGDKFDVWRLGDHASADLFEGKAVPFGFAADEWIVVFDDELGLDYAVVKLQWLYCRGLEVGGITAIERRAWGTPLEPRKQWGLMGIPSESVSYDGVTQIQARMVVVPLDQVDPPALAKGKPPNKYYGKLMDGSEEVVIDVRGMSGGPIYALMWIDERWKYKVIGVQSGWYPADRIVAFCPIARFALMLEAAVRDERQG